MASASNQIDDRAMFIYNASEEYHWLSFDEYFESTKEYYLLLTLHRVVPPTLVSFNCVGSAFTLASFPKNLFTCTAWRSKASLLNILLVVL